MKTLLTTLLLTISLNAQADNDDLAFDFISSESSVLIVVDECVERGIYTINQGDLVKSDDLIHDYNIDEFDNAGDFCQQVYEELYPRQYDDNARIRRIVK